MVPVPMVKKLSIPVHLDMGPNTLAILVLAKLLGKFPASTPGRPSHDEKGAG